MVEALRTLLHRAQLTDQEVRTLRGVVTALERRPTRPRLGADGTITTERGKPMKTRLLAFDSGIGGLSVVREIVRVMPAVETVYVADDAGFPYGDWEDEPLTERIVGLMGALIDRFAPDLVVIPCHTASTLVLPALRARFDIPFVGTVPAIKPAAERTRSRLISVLGTMGTIRRDYTRALIDSFAEGLPRAPRRLGQSRHARRGAHARRSRSTTMRYGRRSVLPSWKPTASAPT